MGLDESILCVPVDRVRHLLPDRGFHPMPIEEMEPVLGSHHLWIGPRRDLETDPRFVQLVAYAMLVRSHEICVYRRTSAGSEDRLHGRLSCGIGGHVALDDIVGPPIAGSESVKRAAIREIGEELGWEVSMDRLGVIGLIWDDSSPVGSVHLGVVLQVEITEEQETIVTESAIGEVRFVARESLREHWGELEGWSQLVCGWVADGVRQQETDRRPEV